SRRHTRSKRDWSSDVCSSDLISMLVATAILFFVWPIVFSGLVSFGTAISNLEFVGAGLYGFFNRLLIPTGLHHALNSVFWFDVRSEERRVGKEGRSRSVRGCD